MLDMITSPALAPYIAAAVALGVMSGFLVYLWSLDRRVRELQQRLAQPHAEDEWREARASDDRPMPLRPERIEKEVTGDIARR